MTAPWTTLVDAGTLAASLGRDDLVILDCRFSLAAPENGPAAYAESRLPGALYAHLDRDLSDHRKPRGGRHPWPDADAFNARLGDWGVTASHQVVAYDDGDGAHAARLWFLLRAIGHERAAVLDGGWAHWMSLGLPSETGTPREVTRVARNGHFDAERLLDAAQVQAHLAGGGMLVDARASERFRGDVEPIDRVGGHVPGAVNRPYADNLAEGRFKPRERLAREFDALLDGSDAADVVVMCGSGVTACHHLLAMEHAGLPGAKLFTGSWSGWIEDPVRPVAKGDA